MIEPTAKNSEVKAKPKKMSGFSTFTNNLSSLSINNRPQTNQPKETQPFMQKTVSLNSNESHTGHKVTELELNEAEINPGKVNEPEKEVAVVKPLVEQDTKSAQQLETKDVVKKEKTAPRKPVQQQQRRNTQRVKSERSNSAGRDLSKGINFAIGNECEEKFVFCHRKQRMSRNSYFIQILENEKRKYESDKDAYIEKNLSKLMEEKRVPAKTEKKTVIKTDQELFDFVTDVAYDFYCNKDKFIRYAIRKEYDRVKKQQ